ncbi:response regulator [Phenylobacterium montanum]|uniref:Response regulator n=1 Tax=Phenylobacterium montanum TaxID=2823693 RepID=A0A975G2Y7_9CAUL|nr:response regulator [Caulobacter sp. S6]QUD89051.1 response regulator [Caulobacter sp. S6]
MSVQTSFEVLLVEDEPLVAIVAEECLRSIGYEPIVAHSAQEARDAIEGGLRPALAVIDVGLPDGRGDELVTQLRRRHPELRVVVVSGYEEDELRAQFQGDRGVTVVAKPYTELDLARATESLGLELREG